VLASGVLWSSNGADSLLDYYINADAQQSKPAEAAYAEPQVYPELAKDAKKVSSIDLQSNRDSGFSVVEAGGKTFAFHLEMVKGKDDKEHSRVCWQCLNPDKDANGTGSTQAVVDDDDVKKATEHDRDKWLQNLSERSDYDFDVAADDKFVFLVVTAAKDFDADGFPARNKLDLMIKDYKFDQNMMAYLDASEEIAAPTDGT
jgi:hypothetical protein